MSTPESAGARPAVLRIEGELSIYRAEELKQALLAALAAAPLLEVDLAAVTELDSAGVQLLMMAKETAAAGQGGLRLSGHSQAVMEVFDLLDLGAWFGDPLVITPHGNEAAQRASQPFVAGVSHES